MLKLSKVMQKRHALICKNLLRRKLGRRKDINEDNQGYLQVAGLLTTVNLMLDFSLVF